MLCARITVCVFGNLYLYHHTCISLPAGKRSWSEYELCETVPSWCTCLRRPTLFLFHNEAWIPLSGYLNVQNKRCNLQKTHANRGRSFARRWNWCLLCYEYNSYVVLLSPFFSKTYSYLHIRHIQAIVKDSLLRQILCLYHQGSVTSHTASIFVRGLVYASCETDKQDTAVSSFATSVALTSILLWSHVHHHHHHHHRVPEGLVVFPVPWSSRWSWSLHLFLGRPMFLRPFGLYCSACFGRLFVSILCTCCGHFFWYCFISFTMFCAPVFCLIHWFFFLSSFLIPSKCLKNSICAASKRCSSLFFSTQASLYKLLYSVLYLYEEASVYYYQVYCSNCLNLLCCSHWERIP